jgi:DNA primase
MTFPPQFLDELRARIVLADLIGRRVKLRKRGREQEGLCPFHSEKTPSFTVSEDKGFFHCFGCGAHGDAIGFVMRGEGLSFPEAVEKLAGEVGLPVPQSSPEERAAARRRTDLGEVLEQACGWFEAQLQGRAGETARGYLSGRGLRAETVAQFRLGFAPGRRGSLQKALNAKGIGDDLLVEAGLLKRPEDGGPLRDYFFDRVVFPIADRRGRVVAFGGRALGEAKAKYLNSPDTPLFHKGRVLYNLARARQAARETGELVVAEGYMDVIALSQAGFPAAVAPLGTAITEQQIVELWRLAAEPVLCLDGDAAGRRAGVRAALAALPGLKPGCSLRFALLPQGEDPDSLLAGQGPEALRRVLDSALGLSDLLWFTEVEGRSFATPERQAGLWRILKTNISGIRDPDVQAAYRRATERRFETAFGYNPVTGRPVTGRRMRGGGRADAGPGSRRGPWPRPPAVPVGRGLRQAPGDLRRRREQVLLAAAINHPEILAEHAEDLAGLELSDTGLRRLAEALVDLIAEAPDLDSDTLKRHLCDQGFSKVLNGLFTRRIYETWSFVKPDTPLAEVRPNWVHLLALHRERRAQLETARAVEALAEDLSEEPLARFQARQRAVQGGESKRVEFDARKTPKPGESN